MPLLRTRLVVAHEAAVFGEFLGEVLLNLPAILRHIRLGPHQKQRQILPSILLQLPYPHLRRLQRLLIRDIDQQQAHLRFFVEFIPHFHIAHFACEVPKLNLNGLLRIQLPLASVHKEIRADSLLVLFREFSVTELVQELSFAYLGIAYDAHAVPGGLFGDFGLQPRVGPRNHGILNF